MAIERPTTHRWYAERLAASLAHLRRRFPRVPLLFRTSFTVHSPDGDWHADRRVHQLRELQRVAVAQAGDVALFDFGELWDGLGDEFAGPDVHIKPRASHSLALWRHSRFLQRPTPAPSSTLR